MDGVTGEGFRRLADEVRALPLGEVAPLLGYCRDSSGKILRQSEKGWLAEIKSDRRTYLAEIYSKRSLVLA